jgi:hypothetical protein
MCIQPSGQSDEVLGGLSDTPRGVDGPRPAESDSFEIDQRAGALLARDRQWQSGGPDALI